MTKDHDCECGPVLGVVFPANGCDVERCDQCQRYDSDRDAAAALATELNSMLPREFHYRVNDTSDDEGFNHVYLCHAYTGEPMTQREAILAFLLLYDTSGD